MNNTLLDDFCTLYQNLNKDNLIRLKEVYSDDVLFTDPIHEVKGIDALTLYFENLYKNMEYCHFQINHVVQQPGEACLVWRMEYSHQKIKNGKKIAVDGCSHLTFSNKIDKHRDYLDLGQMLYEQLPVVGPVIKSIKKRAGK
ncbi:transcriptional regulator [Psychromonas marina]|uniref:Transcriptional regulator n=1 Tax=Psychromonas marina TaxID=88364 RepID=A0ABQ6E3K2_9GAMM|nr:nuclear transport factor 2 family protein [Psychromonas marina]GLS91932.1 transcriptional regulator [Psychromonas marina]